VADHVWKGGAQSTIPSLFDDRLAENPDGEYLDVCGTKLTASQVARAGRRLAAALDDLGSAQHDRIATMLENSPEAVEAWAGIVLGGRIAVPVNTAYKGSYLLHQLADCGAKVVIVAKSLAPRLVEVVHELPDLDHVFILDDEATGTDDDAGRGGELPDLGRVAVHRWTDLQGVEDRQPSMVIRPSDLATFIYTGGTTGPSKGCMLTHNYHAPPLSLQCSHHGGGGHLAVRRAGGDLPEVLGVQLLVRDESSGGDHHFHLGNDGLPPGP
jgi:crotonobetaine/carnitine-CoA ligase